MGIFLFSEKKKIKKSLQQCKLRRGDTQETLFPLLSHSHGVPKIDFLSHKLSGALKKVPLTEGNTLIHALQGDFKFRTHSLQLQILSSSLRNWNRKGEIKNFGRSP